MFQKLAASVLDFFFPITCAGCGEEQTHACAECLRKTPLTKAFCGPPPPEAEAFLQGVCAAAAHRENSTLAELIHRLKYDGARSLAPLLASLIAKRLPPPEISGDALLVPVPLHHRRLNERGFNQNELLAQEIGVAWRLPVCSLIKRIRCTQPQARLTRDERLQNLRGAFALADPDERIHPRKIVMLVDDVCTTGSTLAECARALRSTGAQKIYGLVVARAF